MKYLIATHGEFSKGIIDSVQLIIGEDITIDYFCMTKSKSSEDAFQEVKQYLKGIEEEPLIVLADMFGGSVANLFAEFLLEGYDFQLVTGVNLPMLLNLFLSEGPIKERINNSLEEAKKGILHVNACIENKGGVESDSIIIED
ncbi:PTS sugar transporter subunit IIA [Enterococcus sp. BWT-B8]|uniref:PTS sugar transporter subunit IIA n=1 Tax=unclassified Enterococcus TaxID=2608891 RepID=UPI001E63DB29|nr:MULTISPECIES: PTS sugar transporter subunit IIA [unclassified Enterococcus]MCB5951493.1 PTS sugar transporter subunit IIA [Enterococcus sp. BWT-B8]MCB5955052.1 PTS sugar transporter subunit IIA [Enterococcus sp. CWB-B31]